MLYLWITTDNPINFLIRLLNVFSEGKQGSFLALLGCFSIKLRDVMYLLLVEDGLFDVLYSLRQQSLQFEVSL
ncbi:hypothetical protein [Parabacteroides distasonis]|uniref:hypothetical protein n=1 Tax=Parabacteroides distasonis TaxID=823 RepID=UPI00189CA83A|nr:hypothetical protein [Parabacteroides distasonis]MDB9154012.1 hypothetical protein [Parabacteroides distasonis]MDB9158796.1 hypothetical protein [Parabacteroides distasonis]MDB9167538.1 hypothetical protein [Parabacteroides distasonis]MDB9172098.1 hypothetical protein [Parabacteroides distasonis]MDB9194604.1 hypothetical protein [Parabacteroides distasonis]